MIDTALYLAVIFCFVTCTFADSIGYSNTIYIIPNAEIPPLGQPGLTPIGEERATNCLPKVFGPDSAYNIGFIMACTPNQITGDCLEALPTVQPLATALGLTVNTTCGIVDDGDNCIEDAVASFAQTSSKNILIAWQLDDVDNLTDALDLNDAPDFPKEFHDIVWQFIAGDFITQFSENCPGIDGPATSTPAKLKRSSSVNNK